MPFGTWGRMAGNVGMRSGRATAPGPSGSDDGKEPARIRSHVIKGHAVQQDTVTLAKVDQRASIAKIDGEIGDLLGRTQGDAFQARGNLKDVAIGKVHDHIPSPEKMNRSSPAPP